MLALPSFTAPAGLGPSAALLVATWGLLTLEALLIAEVNLAVGEELRSSQFASGTRPGPAGEEQMVTLRQMAEHTLGPAAGKGLIACYLALSGCFLVAYTCKSTEVLDFFTGGALPPAAAAPAFVGALGGLMYLGGNSTLDKVNQVLTSLILGLFLVILGSGLLQVDWAASAYPPSNWTAAGKAIPIAFLALLYHDLVPVICAYLRHDRAAVRTVLLVGGLVPLAMFLSWEAVALNLLPAYSTASTAPIAAADGQGSATAMVDLLEAFVRHSPPLVGSAVEAFSGLAVVTCFLGTTLGVSETLKTELPLLLARLQPTLAGAPATMDSAAVACEPERQQQHQQRQQQGQGQGQQPSVGPGVLLSLTLGPPLLLTLARPDLFLGALDVAGAYGLTLLYGLLPPVMAWRLRQQQQDPAGRRMDQPGPLVPGGTVVLVAALGVVGAITIGRVSTDLGLPVDAVLSQAQHVMGHAAN
ncbi:hypothetical protein N2152v2_006043 [Parachlorella kessleri]